MRTTLMAAIVAAVVTAASATGAAPGQQTTARPGEMTPPHVWVQNRGTEEAVPVDVRRLRVDPNDVLRVRVINGEASGVLALRAQLVASVWDYRTIVIKANEQAERALAQPGAEGWETTGLSWPTSGGTLLLLKRPR